MIVVAAILWDGFETIIFPRRVTRKARFTHLFYHYTWLVWSKIVNGLMPKKWFEGCLSYYGPLSLLFLLVIWAGGLVFGFSFLHWAAGSTSSSGGTISRFGDCIYFSGTNFFTLGLGDISPHTTSGRILTVIESGFGLGFLALIVGYLPALNQSFARREQTISLLDARAGSPPTAMEMLRRHTHENGLQDLGQFLTLWESWSSELLESHLSYPVLAYFRSQHDNQSWLAALTAILDTTSLMMTYLSGSWKKQAELTFAMARHAVVDLSIVFDTPPCEPDVDRLSSTDLGQLLTILREDGFSLSSGAGHEQQLRDLRYLYEPYLYSLADYLCLAMPPWIPGRGHVDNWRTSAWGDTAMTSKGIRTGRRKSRHF
ncbi:MAG: Ion channel [Syntrophorhabdus sp. PtaU1.Bin153]|nr:MAG: Ion channel [Syntrophorhabdus sp. PtaU1.Bin153]